MQVPYGPYRLVPMRPKRADRQLGAEAARQRLPDVLDRASRGESTLITKHGKPYAAVVPPDGASRRTQVSVVALRGSGKGLWGKAGRHVARLRDEWS